MKFAQYLQETQTPEWKRAYIDYRGLKKRITAIRKAQQGFSHHVSPDDTPDEEATPPTTPRPSDVSSEGHSIRSISRLSPLKPFLQIDPSQQAESSVLKDTPTHAAASGSSLVQQIPPQTSPLQDRLSSFRGRRSFTLPSLRFSGRKGSFKLNRASTLHSNPLAALPLHELLTHLSPYEVSFFTMLDAQLDKVESFYLAREEEMLSRGRVLQAQLRELRDHRKRFLEAHSKIPWLATFFAGLKENMGIKPTKMKRSMSRSTERSRFDIAPALSAAATLVPQAEGQDSSQERGKPVTMFEEYISPLFGKSKANSEGGRDTSPPSVNCPNDSDPDQELPLSNDPDAYLHAKIRLKKAVLEHYRGLEVLHNYRVLNITGFRKALKKFEKVTKITVQNQYMTEKVDKSAFASDKAVKDMMTCMEEMYASAFVRGDKKRALRRLRGGNQHKNHHFSSFRTGLALGLALPALIEGVYKVFQEDTREDIPTWDILLFIYGIIAIPVVFCLLVGLNLLVWAQHRINYVFIFELDVLTRLDHREYFEIPSILLSTLCYAFWLSFSHTGDPIIQPSLWPLIWIAFALLLLSNPLRNFFRPARYWLIRNVGGLFLSGTRPVEFTDFWLGLTFTLSNIFLFVCVYVDGFTIEWRKCGSSTRYWPVIFLLATLPLFIRLVQSLKRFHDSGLHTHMLNAGKYFSGMVSSFFYILWRRHNSGRGSYFVLWVLCNTIYSLYAGSWDLLMDWSLLKARGKHYLLRDELVYTSYVYMYYFAIVSNTLMRFLWILYIPKFEIDVLLLSFILAFLEMLRRWQWNFFRLENEHLGNMDQYRVTREVPLPYSFDVIRQDDDNDDEDKQLKRR